MIKVSSQPSSLLPPSALRPLSSQRGRRPLVPDLPSFVTGRPKLSNLQSNDRDITPVLPRHDLFNRRPSSARRLPLLSAARHPPPHLLSLLTPPIPLRTMACHPPEDSKPTSSPTAIPKILRPLPFPPPRRPQPGVSNARSPKFKLESRPDAQREEEA
jgi:hypothetical protein